MNSAVNANFLADVLDEIALEGLDGITVEALWKRLSVRPNFCLKIDEDSKNFLWRAVIGLEDVLFYKLLTPRLPITYYDTLNQSQDDQKKAINELDLLYPYKKIPGVLGSCADLHTRLDVTAEVTALSYHAMCEEWDTRLVMVASQEARTLALLGDRGTPNIEFPAPQIQFAILEKIGRSRYQGVPSFGEGSLQTVVEDSKAIFHYLKFLLRNNLVKKQSQVGSLQSVTIGHSMFYLTRFFGDQSMECQLILEAAISELRARPGHVIPYDDFYALFDKNKRSRVYKFIKTKLFKKYISGNKMLPFRQLYPSAQQSEWEKKSRTGERVVRCFQLIDPKTEVSDLLDKDYEPDDNEISAGFVTGGVYFMDLPLYSQALRHLKDAGPRGLSEMDLETKTGMDKVLARGMMKRLMKDKSVSFFMESQGRQRTKRYIIGENRQKIEAVEQIEQLLSDKKPEGGVGKVEEGVEGVGDSGDVAAAARPAPDTPTHPKPKLDDGNVSYRTVKRIGLIMKAIKAHRYRKFYQLYKLIADEEAKEGLTAKMDRLTLNKILSKLFMDDCIKILIFTSNYGGDVKTIKLYADPTYFPNEDVASVLVNVEPFTHGQPDENVVDTSTIHLDEVLSLCLVENQIRMKYMTRNVVEERKGEARALAARPAELAYSPKFARLNAIHDLLYYVVYGYSGSAGAVQEDMVARLSQQFALDEDLQAAMPKVYNPDLIGYVFVPPLTNKHAKVPGWCLLSDLLIRMPLAVFLKVARVTDPSPELVAHMDDPVRKHFLLQDLPLAVRQCLFQRRQYLYTINDDLKRLCFMGLLQLGPRCGKDKFQNFIYLNRRSTLLDTTISPPQYYQVAPDLEYPVKRYTFRDVKDVKAYWTDLFNICFETNLGVKSSMIGKDIPAEREFAKDVLRPATEPRTVEEAAQRDTGAVPGDRLGAAGLDSVMFSFLRSNWMGMKKRKPLPAPKPEPPAETMPLEKARRRAFFRRPNPAKVADPARFEAPRERARKTVRRVKKRVLKCKRERRVAYDEADIEALKLMNTLRVSWTPAEDNVLLVCRAAVVFLTPNTRKFVRIPWVEVRKALQRHVAKSRNKTQRAVARRVVYMMKNAALARSVQLCLEELRASDEVRDRFSCDQLLDTILPSAPNLPELQARLYAAFHGLVDYMAERFIAGPSLTFRGHADLIPDTIEQFRDKFQLEAQPREACITPRDIREDVIKGILMSSFCCRADKTSSAVQLFEIYRQYCDEELRSVVCRLNKDKVITLNKRLGPPGRGKAVKMLPLTHSPYRLSFAFQHSLNVKYKHEIYGSSFQQLQGLLGMEGGAEGGVELGECNHALFVLASRGLVTFHVAAPDQIVLLDRNNLRDSTTYSKILERYCEMLKFSNQDAKFVCSSGKIISRGDEEPRVKQEGDPKPSGSEGPEGKGTQDLLMVMREEVTKEMDAGTAWRSLEFFVVSASKVGFSVSKRELEESVRRLDPKAVTRIVKDLVHESQIPLTIIEEASAVSEYASTHTNQETRALRSTLALILSKREMGATNAELRRLGPCTVVAAALRFLVKTRLVIRSGIESTRYIGQKFSHPWRLNSFKMKRLEREKLRPSELGMVQLGEVGEQQAEGGEAREGREGEPPAKRRKRGVIPVTELKSEAHAPPSCSTEPGNKVQVVIRPWIRIDGSLNRKVLDRLLGAVLGHVLARPGASLRAAMARFAPALTPSWTKDLVEVLAKIGCVEASTLVVRSKSTLFDQHKAEFSDVCTGIEDEEFVTLEATVDAVLLLGQFIGNKSYAKDFLVS